MDYSISTLLKAIESKYPDEAKKISSIASKIIKDPDFIKTAQKILDNYIEIDIDELESLTNSNKVKLDVQIPEVSLEDEIT